LASGCRRWSWRTCSTENAPRRNRRNPPRTTDVGTKLIENYEPSDEGLRIVIGPFITPGPEAEADNADTDADEAEQG